MRVTTVYTSYDYHHMEELEPVTDGDDYARHRQLVVVDAVTPISHSISSSSSITPVTPNDGSALQKVIGSEGVRFSKGSPTNMLKVSKFTLPKGWSVKKVPRKVGDLTDKYYRDPETGRQFRSLKEVERYITEGITPARSRVKRLSYFHDEEKVERDITEEVSPKKTRQKMLNYHHDEKDSGSRDMIVANEKDKDNQYQLAIVSPTSFSSPKFLSKLPDGWVVEEVPRRSGGYIDKYYYEPGTGQKFRSMVAVEKHLAELEENSPLAVVLEEIREKSLPLSKAFKLSSPIKNCGSYNSWKKSKSTKEKSSPPRKINWVIAGNGGDAWNAFMDENLVEDSVKQQWRKTFMMEINNSKHNAPVSG